MPVPSRLCDLEAGRTVAGNAFGGNSSALPVPEWLDSGRLRRGQAFLRTHSLGLLFSWLCALLLGFSVPSLTAALIHTGVSVGSAASRKRYLDTLAHLCRWHTGDPFDETSPAGASILRVRQMHDRTRTSMTKLLGTDELPPVSQYDTALVQSGFIGPIISYTSVFGVTASETELEDYVYFWRVMGHLLGIHDSFNMCSGDLATVRVLSKEIEQSVVRPGLEAPSKDATNLSHDFVQGFQVVLPWLSVSLVQGLTFPLLGLPPRPLSWPEWGLLQLLRLLFQVTAAFPFLGAKVNEAVWARIQSFHG